MDKNGGSKGGKEEWVSEISLKSCRKTGRHETRIFAPLSRGGGMQE